MKYTVKINDKEYEVEVEKGQANINSVKNISYSPAPVVSTPKEAAPVAAPKAAVSATNVSGKTIKSPMPGTILDIKVNIGSQIKKGQVVLMLEAMKMENEVTAPFDGTVTNILVLKGATVATDDTLLIIE